MLCGALLGLMLLTRAASAMYPIVFVALALSYPGPRIKRALLVGIPALAIALPWLATLYRNEGRFVFLTTGNGYNFYLGNNRYIPPGRGSAWAQHSVLPFLQQEMIADTGDDHMASWDQAGKRRAWAYIREEPLGAVKRAGIRVLETWQPDTYLGKYFSLGVYPPTLLSRPLVFVATLTHYAILLAGLLGLAITRHKSVLIGVIAAGMIGPMLTIGASRFALPLLVILTIPAGCAVARFWERKRAKSLPAVPIA
jgi:hypothetical protein